ncbi:butyrate kinase [Puteibacter caeruleilacunae]|nr:butyrate kinase [Puteibacter caeruleilacunae]
MNEVLILTINPGSTSTKFALYRNEECVLKKTIRHTVEELSMYDSIPDQFDFRKTLILEELKKENVEFGKIKYVVGRGGLTYPLQSGVYKINNLMMDHLRAGIFGHHASNLGPLIASNIAQWLGNVNAFIADPVVTDELEDIARFSGHPAFERKPIFHALNQKAIARQHARAIGKSYEELNLIVVHLGGGISIGAHKDGRVIDVNNAFNGEGPFTPERSGSLPVGQIVEACFSGKYSKEELLRMITGEGGFVAYAGTNDALEIEKKAQQGDVEAMALQEAMGYQISKSIGEMSTVLKGKVDAILMTGGIAYNRDMMEDIRERVGFIAPMHVYPGEDELGALAMNALLVEQGKTTPMEYVGDTKLAATH